MIRHSQLRHLGVFWLRFIPRRTKELFFAPTTPTRMATGLCSALVGYLILTGQTGFMDQHMHTALSQLMPLTGFGGMGVLCGLLSMYNAFFQVRSLHLRAIEHSGTVAFWTLCLLYSTLSETYDAAYTLVFVVVMWVSIRMDDDGES